MKAKKIVLPLAAAVLVIAAISIVFFLPKEDSTAPNIAYVEFGEDGNVLVQTSQLSEDQVTFLRLKDGGKLELLALKGKDGTAKIALGTCQSCNGSPEAYYTQEGNILRCNNCGLTFSLSVIENPGGGCHPMMLDPTGIEQTEDGVLLDGSLLRSYERLFEGVEEH